MTKDREHAHTPSGKVARRFMSTRLALMVSTAAAGVFLLGTLLAYWGSHAPFTLPELLQVVEERLAKPDPSSSQETISEPLDATKSDTC